ncbi:MAG: hypothetical protein J6E40_01770 [Lachnospiraceae bacterium]|nr:hypothetical protein [Lachnospiraceae bacterium]
MVRWFKLFDHQYFGFWVLGLVLFAIQEIPYMVMPPLYYVAIGLWRRNVLLAALGVVFLVVHFVHVYGNLKV